MSPFSDLTTVAARTDTPRHAALVRVTHVTILGGRQSARTLHFLVSVLLVAFLLVHVAMVWLAGFGTRVMAMITGAPAPTRGLE